MTDKTRLISPIKHLQKNLCVIKTIFMKINTFNFSNFKKNKIEREDRRIHHYIRAC